MTNKTEDRIKQLFNEETKLEAMKISKRIGLTYDTTSKYLKKMTDEGTLERKAEGKPWNYYYKLKKHKQTHLDVDN